MTTLINHLQKHYEGKRLEKSGDIELAVYLQVMLRQQNTSRVDQKRE